MSDLTNFRASQRKLEGEGTILKIKVLTGCHQALRCITYSFIITVVLQSSTTS